MPTKHYQKPKKGFEKRLVKSIKIFLKKKKRKSENRPKKRYQNFTEEEKEKKHQYLS